MKEELCSCCNISSVEYDSPYKLCGECWAWWFAHNEPGDETLLTYDEEQVYYEEIMEDIQKIREKE